MPSWSCMTIKIYTEMGETILGLQKKFRTRSDFLRTPTAHPNPHIPLKMLDLRVKIRENWHFYLKIPSSGQSAHVRALASIARHQEIIWRCFCIQLKSQKIWGCMATVQTAWRQRRNLQVTCEKAFLRPFKPFSPVLGAKCPKNRCGGQNVHVRALAIVARHQEIMWRCFCIQLNSQKIWGCMATVQTACPPQRHFGHFGPKTGEKGLKYLRNDFSQATCRFLHAARRFLLLPYIPKFFGTSIGCKNIFK